MCNDCYFFFFFIVFIPSRQRRTRTSRTKTRRHVARQNHRVQHSIVRTPTKKAAPAVDRGSRIAAVRVRVLTASRPADNNPLAVRRLAAPSRQQRDLPSTRPSRTHLGRPHPHRPAQTSRVRLRAPAPAPALRLQQFRRPRPHDCVRVRRFPISRLVPTVHVCSSRLVRPAGLRRRRRLAVCRCPTWPSSCRPRPRASCPRNGRCCRN